MSPGPIVCFFFTVSFFFLLTATPSPFRGFLFIYYYDGRNRLQHAQRPEKQRREIKGARDVSRACGMFFSFCSFF